MATVRKRGKVWTVDYTDGAGRRRRQDLATKGAADQLLGRVLLESNQALPPSLQNRNVSVREYLGTLDAKTGTATGWMLALGALVKPRTRRLYEILGRLYVIPELGHLRLRQLHRAQIRAFLVKLLADGLKPNSVHTVHSCLNSMLTTAVDDGVLAAHPGRGVAKKLKLQSTDEDEEDIKPFTAEELNQLLAQAGADEPDLYALFAVMGLAGLRIGEALALRWTKLDYAGREIRVSRTLAPPSAADIVAGRLGTPKSGKARTVDMNSLLVPVLQMHEARARARSLATGHGGALGTFVFARSGQPLDESKVRVALTRLLRRAGLPTYHTPHHLRHTFCALLLSDGVPVTYVMTQAGHRSIDTTVRYYGRWIPKSDRSLIERLCDKLNPARAALAQAMAGGRASPDPAESQSSQSVSNPAVLSGFLGNFSQDLLSASIAPRASRDDSKQPLRQNDQSPDTLKTPDNSGRRLKPVSKDGE
jgi:integrase